MQELYLDANAHLPLNPKAALAYLDFSKSPAAHGHPSSPSLPGRLAAAALETARAKIASLIGAQKPGNIIFTGTATSAAEWGLEMFFQLPDNDNVATSPLEHSAIKDAFSVLAEEFVDGVTFTIPINKNGRIETTERYQKTCCIHVQNEIGTIQPINDIKTNILFSDMSQSLGKIPINLKETNVDFAIFGSHKFGGPGGFGFIYLKNTAHWESHGAGSRYFLDRSGTPDVAGAVASAVALEEAVSSLESRTNNAKTFQSIIEDGIEKLGFEIIGKKAERVSFTTFVSMPGKGLTTVFKLGEAGIHTGLGSACGSMHTGKSPTMAALGINGGIHDFMRISQFGDYGEKEAKLFLSKFEKAL